ncbi:hypothetical protein D3C74_475890 [compost metagenome]
MRDSLERKSVVTMIEKLIYDGDPKDISENDSIQKILLQIDDEDYFYHVGIDLAKRGYSDYSAVAKFKRNDDNTYVYYGTELV